jgi:hypothetical protein
VTLLEPSPSIEAFTSNAKTYVITTRDTRDEISAVPDLFYLVRTSHDRPVQVLVGDRVSYKWLFNGTGAPVEADWSPDGKTVDLYAKPGTIRVYAPNATTIRLNGKAVETSVDGDFRKVSR